MVVVGVDGSRESEAALRFAADEAKLRGALLRIVCASEPSASGYLGEAFAPTPDDFVNAEHHAEEVLRGALQQLKGEPLEVEAVAEEGGPTAVLLEQAAGRRTARRRVTRPRNSEAANARAPITIEVPRVPPRPSVRRALQLARPRPADTPVRPTG